MFKKLFHNRKRNILLLTTVLCALIIFFLPESVFAATEKSTSDKLLEATAQAIKLTTQFVYPLIWLVTTFIGSLMDNEMIFGGGMEELLRSIWVQIRNFVNVAFVLVLIGIALYNVFGQTEGNFVLKTVLPKFVIALVLVNFSFFIGKVIIDFSQAAATVIFSLPSQVYSKDMPVKCTYYDRQQDGTVKQTPMDCPLPVKMRYNTLPIAKNKVNPPSGTGCTQGQEYGIKNDEYMVKF